MVHADPVLDTSRRLNLRHADPHSHAHAKSIRRATVSTLNNHSTPPLFKDITQLFHFVANMQQNNCESQTARGSNNDHSV